VSDFATATASPLYDQGLLKALLQVILDLSRSRLLVVDGQGEILLSNLEVDPGLGTGAGASLARSLPALWEGVRTSLSDGRPQDISSLAVGGEAYWARVHPVHSGPRIVAAVVEMGKAGEGASPADQILSLKEMTRERDAIIDSSSDGLFVCDGDATVIRMNPASERIHKVEAAAVIGRNMVDLIEEGFIDQSAALEAIKTQSVVNLLQTKDNRKLISTGTPVFDDEGQLIRVVVSEKDITKFDALQRRLEEEQEITSQLQNQLAEMQQDVLSTHEIIARSDNMITTLKRALKVSRTDASILISGESGVGKGLIANLIHKRSSRSEKPLIRINCGAIPESLVESELFGYEKGAFTGAQADGKPGHLELADGGTLFLDEIAELPLPAQVKLLRFLENGRLTRLGGTRTRRVDARIIAATHRHLQQMVVEGDFRQDLYYRLKVIPLSIPPVRDRKDCLLPLLRHYVDHFARKVGSTKRLSRAAIDALLAYTFPGNVRELMNICERLVVMSEMEVIDLQDLPREVLTHKKEVDNAWGPWPPQMTLDQILQSVERAHLLDALHLYRNQTQIAHALGVSQPTVARRMKKYGLSPHFSISG
jgi:PAS domain S-box-containing protein